MLPFFILSKSRRVSPEGSIEKNWRQRDYHLQGNLQIYGYKIYEKVCLWHQFLKRTFYTPHLCWAHRSSHHQQINFKNRTQLTVNSNFSILSWFFQLIWLNVMYTSLLMIISSQDGSTMFVHISISNISSSKKKKLL